MPNPVFSADGSRVVYAADQDQNDVVELFVVPADGSQAPLKLNPPLVAGGDVTRFAAGNGGRVLYLVDQEQDEVHELYLAELDVPPKAPFGPMDAPSRSRKH